MGMMTQEEYDPVRADRLRRNRESARKCRLKRKGNLEQTEQRLSFLSAENASLHRENERLLRRVAELEASNNMNNNTQQHQLDSTVARKRTRHESGVTIGYDSSESAVFATTSQQTEYFLLATVTTALYSMIAEKMMMGNKTCSSQDVSEQEVVGAKTEAPTHSHSTAVVTPKVASRTTPTCLSRSKACVNNSWTCSPTPSLWNCQTSLRKHRGRHIDRHIASSLLQRGVP